MRNPSPLYPLEAMGDFVPLPLPKYAIGTRVDPAKLTANDLAYYRRLLLRGTIRHLRKSISRLQRDGYLTEMKGKKMLPGNKDALRRMLRVMSHADSVELAGMMPEGMHVTGHVAHQSYLRNGQTHSGVGYRYYLLFRATQPTPDGVLTKVVVIPPEPILSECYVRELLVSPATTATASP